jgi:hypothetical protein
VAAASRVLAVPRQRAPHMCAHASSTHAVCDADTRCISTAHHQRLQLESALLESMHAHTTQQDAKHTHSQRLKRRQALEHPRRQRPDLIAVQIPAQAQAG